MQTFGVQVEARDTVVRTQQINYFISYLHVFCFDLNVMMYAHFQTGSSVLLLPVIVEQVKHMSMQKSSPVRKPVADPGGSRES